MENVAPQDERALILKRIENIGNRDVDGRDAAKQLQDYLHTSDCEVALAALQATWNYVKEEDLFRAILGMARKHTDEDVRGMANSCLGAVIRDGLAFEEDIPEDAQIAPPLITSEFYFEVKEHLLARVDAPMESMEVRRRCVEALGYLAYKPEIHSLVLRFYHQAPNPWVKVSSLFAMALYRDPVFERLVLEELYSTNENILLEAVHAIGCLELHAAESRLVELSLWPSAEIRCEAIISLGLAATPSRLPEILNALEERFPDKDTLEAISMARKSHEQRNKLNAGETLWDDTLILGEIEDMIADSNGGNE
jgi:hypothetical protein